MLLPRILVLDRGLGMEFTGGQNKKKRKKQKTHPGPSGNPLKLKQIMKFCFCRVDKSAAGSAREQWDLCWTLVWVSSARGERGQHAWQYQSTLWEILTVDSILPYFVQTCCITQGSIRHFGWQGQIYCRGHLRHLCTKSMSLPRICWGSQLRLGWTTECVPQLVDIIKKHNQAKIHVKQCFFQLPGGNLLSGVDESTTLL